jgi:hypothetical protein
MAKLNVNKWQASRRGPRYTPVMQMYLRQIRMAILQLEGVECLYSFTIGGDGKVGRNGKAGR